MNPVQMTILAFMAVMTVICVAGICYFIYDAVSSFIRWKRGRRESMKPGEIYKFDSAEQLVRDVWGRTVRVAGRHSFEKVKDTITDKICGRSWYIVDGWLLVDVGRGSYLETRCLEQEEQR